MPQRNWTGNSDNTRQHMHMKRNVQMTMYGCVYVCVSVHWPHKEWNSGVLKEMKTSAITVQGLISYVRSFYYNNFNYIREQHNHNHCVLSPKIIITIVCYNESHSDNGISLISNNNLKLTIHTHAHTTIHIYKIYSELSYDDDDPISKYHKTHANTYICTLTYRYRHTVKISGI